MHSPPLIWTVTALSATRTSPRCTRRSVWCVRPAFLPLVLTRLPLRLQRQVSSTGWRGREDSLGRVVLVGCALVAAVCYSFDRLHNVGSATLTTKPPCQASWRHHSKRHRTAPSTSNHREHNGAHCAAALHTLPASSDKRLRATHTHTRTHAHAPVHARTDA
jgi:hypothetical protein